MPNKNRSSRIKNEPQYEALREKGYSKQKAARIANTENAGQKGGNSKNMKSGAKRSFMIKPGRLVLMAGARCPRKNLSMRCETIENGTEL